MDVREPMGEPITVAAGNLMSNGLKTFDWWKSRQVRKHPITVSLELHCDDGEQMTLLIHADNDSQFQLEVSDCFIQRHRTTGGCGEPERIRDDVVSPTPVEMPAAGVPYIIVPAIGRRSWQVTVSRTFIRDTLERELYDAERRIYPPDEADNLKRKRDAKCPSTHPLARLGESQMRLWAVVQLANHARKMESTSLDLPPLKLMDVLADWWEQRLKPRLRVVLIRLRS